MAFRVWEKRLCRIIKIYSIAARNITSFLFRESYVRFQDLRHLLDPLDPHACVYTYNVCACVYTYVHIHIHDFMIHTHTYN